MEDDDGENTDSQEDIYDSGKLIYVQNESPPRKIKKPMK